MFINACGAIINGFQGLTDHLNNVLIATLQDGVFQERGNMETESWDVRCLNSIRQEKKEAEKYYGIRINLTDIQCSFCGKSWNFFHICGGTNPERRNEIERIKEEWNRPISLMGIGGWRQELGIEVGMSKEEALEKFTAWQLKKKTCQRCEGDKYFEYCPIRLVCKEANDVRNVEGDDNRSRINEINGSKTLGIELSSARKRVSLR